MNRQLYQQEFEKVYQEFSIGIFRYVYFKVNDYQLAEDITAETFADFWQKLSNGEKIDNCKAFLYFIAHSTIVDHYRSASKKKTHIGIDEVPEIELEEKIDLTRQIILDQEKEQILNALNRIRVEYKEILLMYYIEELKIGEIAFALDKNENNVRVSIHRALKALKEVI